MNKDDGQARLDAYIARKSQEKSGTDQSSAVKDRPHRGRQIFFTGFLIALIGSFCNGLLIQFEVAGILGKIVRESLRLLILIGLFLMVVSFLRKFWKPLLGLFLLAVVCLIGWNYFGNPEVDRAGQETQIVTSRSSVIDKIPLNEAQALRGSLAQGIYDELGWFVDVHITNQGITNGSEIERKVIITFYLQAEEYQKLVSEGGGRATRSPRIKNYIQKSTAVIKNLYPDAPEHFAVKVKAKLPEFDTYVKGKTDRLAELWPTLRTKTTFDAKRPYNSFKNGKLVLNKQ